MTTPGNQQLPSFKKPPINEVVLGCQFEQLKEFKVTHFGDLWARLRKDFPKVEHAPPIASASGFLPEDQGTGLPWPRSWFINNTDSRLIQFQPDRFYYNWRKREKEQIYPRYPEIFSCFENYFKVFGKFVSENSLGPLKPTTWELTYTNQIPVGEVSSSKIEVFRDVHWMHDPNRFLPEPTNPAWAATFHLPNDAGVLVAKLITGKMPHEDTKIQILELAVRGPAKDRTETAMKEWFDLAREWIVRGFTDLTTNEAHGMWEREK
ncbi:TIGR04255 family protein [Pseudomonas sp. Q11]|uniref:TIGR04255 family protein n=1 Tax=Pseudomonas sp. Q11 TaxID=2968470 RepID=UPI00210D1E11|nr:TIGR04255 family protein [Pseudomonas sp. Q11]MCQ6259809.1 TIGR04255 family protein [Pseudomonas sp. Q11]